MTTTPVLPTTVLLDDKQWVYNALQETGYIGDRVNSDVNTLDSQRLSEDSKELELLVRGDSACTKNDYAILDIFGWEDARAFSLEPMKDAGEVERVAYIGTLGDNMTTYGIQVIARREDGSYIIYAQAVSSKIKAIESLDMWGKSTARHIKPEMIDAHRKISEMFEYIKGKLK